MAKQMIDTDWIVERPITHRGLHDSSKQIMENSLASAKASIDAGYPIELDIQPSADGVPMVFHDYDLKRLTGANGKIRETKSEDLQAMRYVCGQDAITTLADYLRFVVGQVGLILELKGLKDNDDGFVKAVAKCLKEYDGNAAVMSFDQWLVEDMVALIDNRPIGLTAYGDDTKFDTHIGLPSLQKIHFISYEFANVDCRFVRDMREAGKASISWTVRSLEDQAKSDKYCDQITFEGFTPDATAITGKH